MKNRNQSDMTSDWVAYPKLKKIIKIKIKNKTEICPKNKRPGILKHMLQH